MLIVYIILGPGLGRTARLAGRQPRPPPAGKWLICLAVSDLKLEECKALNPVVVGSSPTVGVCMHGASIMKGTPSRFWDLALLYCMGICL